MIIDYLIAFLVIFSVVLVILLYFLPDVPIVIDKKKTLPSISIILPVYNEENSIGQTIHSVCNSSYPKNSSFELLVIDDGSKDNTYNVAKTIAKEYPNKVKVYRKENGGKSKALNFGILESSGQIIATLDADCIVGKNSIELLCQMFSDSSVMAATAAVKIKEPKNFLEKMQQIEYLFILFNRKLMANLNSVNVTPGPLSVFRRKVFDEIGLFDTSNIMEDQEIALRIQSKNYRIVTNNQAIVYTIPPSTFSSYVRQRVRWNRGGLRNLINYYYLIHPNYGDFGILIMPLWVLSVLAIFAVMGLVINNIITGNFFEFLKYGLLIPIIYGIGPISILSIFSIALGLIWTALGWWYYNDENLTLWNMFLYFFIYPILSTYVWLVTLFKELKMEPLKW